MAKGKYEKKLDAKKLDTLTKKLNEIQETVKAVRERLDTELLKWDREIYTRLRGVAAHAPAMVASLIVLDLIENDLSVKQKGEAIIKVLKDRLKQG